MNTQVTTASYRKQADFFGLLLYFRSFHIKILSETFWDCSKNRETASQTIRCYQWLHRCFQWYVVILLRMRYHKKQKELQRRTAGDGSLFTKCLQIHTLLFAEKMSVVKWREVRSSREQDSTEVPDFAFRSFCPIGILLGSAFPKPCYTQPDGCGNLAQRQSFASSIAAQGFENHLSWNRLPQKKFSHRHTQQTADFCPLKSRKGNFPEAAPPNSQNNCPLQSERAKHWDKNGSWFT